MQKTLRIYKAFLSTSLAREMEFRANFIAKIFKNMIWTVFFWLLTEVIFLNTDQIAGWTKGEVLLLTGVVMLVDATIETITFEMFHLSDHVRKGTLDFVLTKPIDAQYWLTFRRFSFDRLGSWVASIIICVYGISNITASISAIQWIAFFIIILCATAIYYALAFFLSSFAIKHVKVDNIWVLAMSALDVSRFPADIFNPVVRKFITFILPLSFFGTIPVSVLVGKMPLTYTLWAIFFAILTTIISRVKWNMSLKSYTSASS